MAKFLFDECLGLPIIEPLTRLIGMGKGEKPHISHVLTFVPPGTHDEIWIPKIADEAWTLVTGDGGRQPNKLRGEKLPDLCTRLGVTHVILSSTVHQRTAFEKLLTILSVWYELLEVANSPEPRGSRYMIEPAAPGRRGHGRLTRKRVASSSVDSRGFPPGDQSSESSGSAGSGT